MFGLLTYFRDAVPNLHFDMTPGIETPQIAATERTQSRRVKWGERLALYLGILSQLATVASYVYLYKFAGANILAL
jgi:hypothetical protein